MALEGLFNGYMATLLSREEYQTVRECISFVGRKQDEAAGSYWHEEEKQEIIFLKGVSSYVFYQESGMSQGDWMTEERTSK